MKRIVSILLVLLMLFSFVACSGSKDDEAESTTTAATNSGVDEGNQNEVLEVPEKDFGGKELTLVQRASYASEFYTEEETGDLIPDAVYKRNKFVEDYLKIKLVFEELDGDNTAQKRALDSSMVTGEEVYHITANYACYAVNWVTENLFWNINAISEDVNHINPSKIWWNQNYAGEATINGKQYFLVGDACTSATLRAEVLVYNETLLEEYLEEDPEEFLNHVYDRTWTYEYFLQCVEKVGNGSENGGLWGATLQCNSTSIDGFLGSLAIPIVARTESGSISLAYNGEKTIEIAEALRDLYQNNLSVQAHEEDNMMTAFVDGRAIFYGGMLNHIGSEFRKLGWDYAVIPFPLWDENQTEYRSCPHDEYSILGIPITVVESMEAVTATIEVMTAESYKSLRPVVYEQAYGHRYLKTSAKAEMFNYIIDHLYFDFGYIYTAAMGKPVQDIFRNFVRYRSGHQNHVSSLQGTIEGTWEANTLALNDYLEAFQ